jgi:hypothetical protein
MTHAWCALQVSRSPAPCARACGLDAECTTFHYNKVGLLFLQRALVSLYDDH